ncbi:MAG: hypothetical protein RLZZ324_520 [Candidatus Parcubacteria bacterium]
MHDAAYWKAFSEALDGLGVSWHSSSYLRDERCTDFLFYEDASGQRVRPLAVRIRTGRDDADDLKRFCRVQPLRVASGEIRRLYLQGLEDVPVMDAVSRTLSLLTFDAPSAASVLGEEWTSGGWEEFAPRERTIALGVEESALLPEQSEPRTFFHREETLASPTPAPSRPTPALAVHAEPAPVPEPAITEDTSELLGFRFERRLAAACQERGMTIVANNALDKENKTDLLIVQAEGESDFRPLAVQVTLSWNDLIKMEGFLRDKRAVMAGDVEAQRLYVQVARHIPAEDVARALRAYLRSSAHLATANRLVFAECDVNGFRIFNAEERVAMMRARADIRLTRGRRLQGSVKEINDGGIVITEDASGVPYFARRSEIVDQALRVEYRKSMRGGTFVGTRVSFIPYIRGVGQGGNLALSIIGAPTQK